LLAKDPSYRARLRALPPVDRERLLGGNWNVRASAGTMFRRHWFQVVEQAPPLERVVRTWDFAATEPTPANPDPDWTRGLKLGITDYGQRIVLDLVSARANPGEAEQLYPRTLQAHGPRPPQGTPTG